MIHMSDRNLNFQLEQAEKKKMKNYENNNGLTQLVDYHFNFYGSVVKLKLSITLWVSNSMSQMTFSLHILLYYLFFISSKQWQSLVGNLLLAYFQLVPFILLCSSFFFSLVLVAISCWQSVTVKSLQDHPTGFYFLRF